MENLTCELNGVKYLLVEVIVIPKYEKKVLEKCTKYECIAQGIKEINTTGSKQYAILKILVPENNIIEFNKSDIIDNDSDECKDLLVNAAKFYINFVDGIIHRIKTVFVSSCK